MQEEENRSQKLSEWYFINNISYQEKLIRSVTSFYI